MAIRRANGSGSITKMKGIEENLTESELRQVGKLMKRLVK